MCPLFGNSTVHKEEDNLSIVDKMAGPNVSHYSEAPLYPTTYYTPDFYVSISFISDADSTSPVCSEWCVGVSPCEADR